MELWILRFLWLRFSQSAFSGYSLQAPLRTLPREWSWLNLVQTRRGDTKFDRRCSWGVSDMIPLMEPDEIYNARTILYYSRVQKFTIDFY